MLVQFLDNRLTTTGEALGHDPELSSVAVYKMQVQVNTFLCQVRQPQRTILYEASLVMVMGLSNVILTNFQNCTVVPVGPVLHPADGRQSWKPHLGKAMDIYCPSFGV